jgi:acetyltransferase-like isoleucine patch superfamily enzyme
MDRSQTYSVIDAPREGVNDDVVRILEWMAADGDHVEEKQAVVVLETSKSTFELQTSRAGYLFSLAPAGTEVPVGAPLALLADQPKRPQYEPPQATPQAGSPARRQIVTKKARTLIEKHALSLGEFAALEVVRFEDVEAVLARRVGGGERPPARKFGGEELDPGADWDAMVDTELTGRLRELLTALRKRMKAKFNRHVPIGDLLYDRWELANDYGFGEGTSVYDECLILGDVQVGRHCWIGPYTILDGNQAPLRIGDYVDLGAGTHIYTHNTIERALTGHRAQVFKKPTTIGNCCFIAPNVTIAPGTVIADHCFVAAGSYVEGSFPSFSYIAGSPAKRVGVVEICDNHARLRRFSADEPGE